MVKGLADQSFAIILGVGLVVAILFLFGGFLIGKAFART
jgi:hypothetical protein